MVIDGHPSGQIPLEIEPARSPSSSVGGRKSGRKILTVACLALSQLSAFLAFSIIAPFYPREASLKGVSDVMIGFTFGVFQLVVFLASPIFGSLIVKLGAKYLYISGSFMCSGCIILFGVLDSGPGGTTYLLMCIACRAMDAVGTAMMTTAIFAIAAHEFPERMSMVLGILEACVGVGYMTGPLLGGGLYQVGGYKLPFMVNGAVLLVSTVCAFLLVPSIEGVIGNKSFVKLYTLPDAALAYALIVAAQYGMTSLEPTLAKHLLSIDDSLSPATIGAVYLIIPGTYSIGAPFIGRACDKGYTKPILLIGCLTFCASMLFVGPSPLLVNLPRTLWLTLLSMVFLGVAMVAMWLPTFQLALSAATKNGYKDDLHTHGMVAGLFNSGAALGAFIGPFSAGYVSSTLGFGWMVTISAAVSLLMAMVTVISWLLNERRYRCQKTSAVVLEDDRRAEPI